MKKQLRLLVMSAVLGSCLQAATTTYINGPVLDSERIDTVIFGSSGSFNGFSQPGPEVQTLVINFVSSGTTVGRNTTRTNAYTGLSGSPIPYLPSTVKQVILQGDATDYATAVLGNSDSAYGYTSLSGPQAYALVTPNKNTVIRFALQHKPSVAPACWFQTSLLAGCTVEVDLNSQDPYLQKIVPLNGGNIVIGSPVSMGDAMNDELALVNGSLTIMRHPSLLASQARTQAPITLIDNITFPYSIYGCSMTGAYNPTFAANSYLVDMDPSTAGQHITINEGYTVEVYYNQITKPAFPTLSFGINADFNPLVKTAKSLPKISLPTIVTKATS